MNGPLIAATDIDLQNAQTFTNSGTVQAGNTLSIQGNASTFVPVPGFPAIGAGGGVSHAYGGQTSIEYGLSFPPGTAVNPVSYGFEMKK